MATDCADNDGSCWRDDDGCDAEAGIAANKFDEPEEADARELPPTAPAGATPATMPVVAGPIRPLKAASRAANATSVASTGNDGEELPVALLLLKNPRMDRCRHAWKVSTRHCVGGRWGSSHTLFVSNGPQGVAVAAVARRGHHIGGRDFGFHPKKTKASMGAAGSALCCGLSCLTNLSCCAMSCCISHSAPRVIYGSILAVVTLFCLMTRYWLADYMSGLSHISGFDGCYDAYCYGNQMTLRVSAATTVWYLLFAILMIACVNDRARRAIHEEYVDLVFT